MTPFQRLGLYAAAAIVAGAIAYTISVVLWVGVGSLVGGALLALLATIEARATLPEQEEPAEPAELTQARDQVLRHRTREDIVRSRERAERESEEDELTG